MWRKQKARAMKNSKLNRLMGAYLSGNRPFYWTLGALVLEPIPKNPPRVASWKDPLK